MKRIFAVVSLAVLATASSAATGYPEKPVRLIVPFAAGGPSDAAARAVGKALARITGQPTVIDNRPGANGAIASAAALNAQPDGHTILWGVGSMVGIPMLQKRPPFDSFSRFTPVSMVGHFAFGMYVHPNVPAKSVAEFATYARANHQQLTFASSTLSEFLAATQFMNASKTAMTRVSYKGGAQALPDLLAGRVQVYFTPLGLALPYAREGRLRLLATLLPQRTQAAPDVPTMSEAGMPGVAVPSWQAMFAPPATAPIVSETLFRQAQRVLADAELRAQFDSIVLQIEGSTPQQLGRVVARDIETWRDFIRDNEIPQD